MRIRLCLLFLAIFSFGTGFATTDPTATNFSADECRGSMSLYPAELSPIAVPDSLTPIFINHVGRHGSRYPASSKGIQRLAEALSAAAEGKALTPVGKELRSLVTAMTARVGNQWGALDSIGMAEQRAIASRMYKTAPSLFDGGHVEAISSYSPRCIMSMYYFTQQLARLNNKVELTTASGRSFSSLLRPFDTDAEYREYRASHSWQSTLDAFRTADIPLEPITRALGDVSGYTPEQLRELAMDEYDLVAGAAAAGVACNSTHFFNQPEYNRLWQASNLRHYLLYSSSTLSTIPADMASPLLRNIIDTTERAAAGEDGMPRVMLRFGHAETLMPLLALMRMKGCYYMTNYFETVATHWQDFNIVPLAANLQLMLLRTSKGELYLRVELNGRLVPLMPGSDELYIKWERARDYLNRCIPIFYQF